MQYVRTIQPGGTFFFTLVTNNRLPIFNSTAAIDTLREAIRYVKAIHPFIIEAFVLLPDHLHCIWTLPDNDSDYSNRWRMIKSIFSKNLIDDNFIEKISLSRKQKKERGFWQRRFWEHLVRNEDDFNKCFDYIHYNPVKHDLVHAPRDWRYSSFHKFVELGVYDLNWGEDDIFSEFKNE